MLYFVYELIDPHDNEPGYVGITINPNLRFQQHLGDLQNERKRRWIQELQNMGHQPLMRIIEVVNELSIAHEREKYWVEQYTIQGFKLMNDRLVPMLKTKKLDSIVPPAQIQVEAATDWLHYEDVVEAYNLNCKIYGFESPLSPTLTWPWWKKNPYASRVIFDKNNRKEIWGQLSIIPMPEEIILKLVRKEISKNDIRPEHVLTYESGKHYSCYVAPIAINVEHRHLFKSLLQSVLEFWRDQPNIHIDRLYTSAIDNWGNCHSKCIWEMYFWPRRDIAANAWELDFYTMNPNPVIQEYQDYFEQERRHVVASEK